MRFGSVCSGIEAASVAWEPLGWKAAWFSEIEPFPSAVLAHHYPETPNLGDMTEIPALLALGEVEAPDILCGGTPCQAFSVAGLRRSLDDARGNLSLTFCEIANAIDHARAARGEQPCIVFWENVPGVLSTKDNAFGCFLAGLAGEDDPLVAPGGKWSNSGVVLGPQRAVAWRTLDAQYFGLAQRRRRVFVVASSREGFDPASVLLEWDGVRRDSAPSREAGEAIAPTVMAGAPNGGPGHGARSGHTKDGLITPVVGTIGCNTGPNGHGFGGFLNNQAVDAGHILAFGGNNTAGPIDVATACNAHGGDRPPGTDVDTADSLIPVAYTTKLHNTQSNQAGKFYEEYTTSLDRSSPPPAVICQHTTHTLRGEGFDASEDGTGRGTPLVPVAFPANLSGTQCASSENIAPAMGAKNPTAVAFADTAPTLAQGTGGGAGHLYRQKGNETALVGAAMQVRRLTPVECERLQGFPDGYTAIPWRNKPASECPDGPRYKALGNSWAVPVVRWIGWRIDTLANLV